MVLVWPAWCRAVTVAASAAPLLVAPSAPDVAEMVGLALALVGVVLVGLSMLNEAPSGVTVLGLALPDALVLLIDVVFS